MWASVIGLSDKKTERNWWNGSCGTGFSALESAM